MIKEHQSSKTFIASSRHNLLAKKLPMTTKNLTKVTTISFNTNTGGFYGKNT